jgi:hypothetical protein
MKTYLYLFSLLSIGFIVYWLVKDSIFGNDTANNIIHNLQQKEGFEHPAKAPIEIRQAPIYPERSVAASGPNPPNQAPPSDEVILHNEPVPKDPYYESQESSAIPENLRYPERSFRPTVANNQTQIAVEAGIANNNMQISSDNSQQFSTDFIQNGGEFMNGIYANDTYNDTNYSAF